MTNHNDIIKRARKLLATNPDISPKDIIRAVAKHLNIDWDKAAERIGKIKPKKVKLENKCDMIAELISEDPDINPKAAVAVCLHNGKFLLGKSTACDARNGKWTFPGGFINNDETPEEAACREANEETGVKCQPIRRLAEDEHGDVVFVLCRIIGGRIDYNDEFSKVALFTPEKARKLNTYDAAGIIGKI